MIDRELFPIYTYILIQTHAPVASCFAQFLSSFIHCWCMGETAPQFATSSSSVSSSQDKTTCSHSSWGLLEDLSPEISITCSAGLVNFIDPILKNLSVCAIKDFDGSEHCIVHFVSAGSCQLLKCFLLTPLAGSHHLQGSGLDIGQFHQCCA